VLALIRTLRPRQWFKNSFVGVPLLFGQRLTDPDSVLRTANAFVLFCLVSGCVYVINDIVDIEKDRLHLHKRHRPIAAGELSLTVARAFVIVTIPLAMVSGYWLAPLYAATLGGYFALNLAYSFWLKQVGYLDVLSIATGFILRVLGGAFCISLAPSPWLLWCTGLLAMFLGFGKRAHELATSPDPLRQRSALAHYNLTTLRWILHVLAIAIVVVYAFYTRSQHVAETFGTDALTYTVPFSVIGILRFIHLTTNRPHGESPTEEMLRDPLFMFNFAAWTITTAAILYGYIG